METLPSVKAHHPKTLSFIDSNRKETIHFKSQPNFIFSKTFRQIKGLKLALHSSIDEGVSINQQSLENLPLTVDLEPISSENQFDRVISEAQHLQQSVIILWMASWCRKCIYVKPKLEKLAADYYQRIRFYSVDVNSVPHKLVVRAEVTKMPTIQLWKDGKKQAEVIGGHKAYLVVNEVREMIDNENPM